MHRIAVLAHVVTDEIYDPRGRLQAKQVGGAGAYAAVGASLVAGPLATLIVSGVGRLDLPDLAEWCVAREVDPSGLFEVGDHSPLTRIRYSSDGERTEEPAFGEAHFEAMTPLPGDVPVAAESLGGVYLFHDAERSYWEEVAASRAAWKCPVLWEVAANACVPQNLPVVRQRTESIDILSLNMTEAHNLLSSAQPDRVWALLGHRELTIVLRLGSAGSLIIDQTGAWTVGVATGAVADPTGGGNSYSGAFVAGMAETGDIGESARLAAAAASLNIAQAGAPTVNATQREKCLDLASKVTLTRMR